MLPWVVFCGSWCLYWWINSFCRGGLRKIYSWWWWTNRWVIQRVSPCYSLRALLRHLFRNGESTFSVGVKGWEQSTPGGSEGTDEQCKESPPTISFVLCSSTSLINLITSLFQEAQTVVSYDISLQRAVVSSCVLNKSCLSLFEVSEELSFTDIIMSSLVCNWTLNFVSLCSRCWKHCEMCSCWTSRSCQILRELTMCDCDSECIWLCTNSLSLSPTWTCTWYSCNIWFLWPCNASRASDSIICVTLLSFSSIWISCIIRTS